MEKSEIQSDISNSMAKQEAKAPDPCSNTYEIIEELWEILKKGLINAEMA
ncbi:hypothetical protein H5410_061665 [Solanum commersonii]|uniref:Uncharacterized protein n=1 Tax=Solanum commersonii TaxID=4109 RepID=A0A9J5W8C2_SOLCO|nr:hypothetical protein H5410_061665 [Solanum commersonii]